MIARLILFVLLLAGLPLRAQPLVAELGKDVIEVSTAFAGDTLLVFGAFEPPGDVVVVARGEPRTSTVRQKVSFAGIWLNGPSARFRSLPAFYAVGATRPVTEILEASERRGATVGLDTLATLSRGSQDPAFREALIRIREAQGMFVPEVPMDVVGGRLFHARVPVPSLVEPGNYRVEVLLVRDGRVVARQELPWSVSRVGFAAEVNRAATTQPALYGLACILIAAFAGWLGAFLFRRN